MPGKYQDIIVEIKGRIGTIKVFSNFTLTVESL